MATGLNRKLLLGSNLKMYKTVSETILYLEELMGLTNDIPREELNIFIIPSFVALHAASKTVDHGQIRLGAQNMFWEDRGPWTGEISPLMLADLNLKIIELGHSERRQHFGETDLDVNKKVLAGLKHGFTPLICVGETADEKDYNISEEVVRRQLKIALRHVSLEMIHKVWIAYEPVWAIGESGTPASAEYANKMHGVIRDTLKELFPGCEDSVSVLYGGSVSSYNAVELIEMPEIDGLFIGRSAWDARSFNNIIRDVLLAWQKKGEK